MERRLIALAGLKSANRMVWLLPSRRAPKVCGPIASVEQCSWHVGFTLDSGRVAALPRTVKTGQKPASRRLDWRRAYPPTQRPGARASVANEHSPSSLRFHPRSSHRMRVRFPPLRADLATARRYGCALRLLASSLPSPLARSRFYSRSPRSRLDALRLEGSRAYARGRPCRSRRVLVGMDQLGGLAAKRTDAVEVIVGSDAPCLRRWMI